MRKRTPESSSEGESNGLRKAAPSGSRRGMTACRAAAFAAGMIWLAGGLAGCAAAPAPQPGAPHASGSVSTGGTPGMFRGDRVTIDREFVYLDDPLFLQRKSVYAFRKAGFFSFQIPIYFNASQDTLRFASNGIRIRTKGPKAPAVSCVVDTGEALADSSAVTGMFQDTGRILVFQPGRGRNKRVRLNIHCIGYDPPRGRVDTLSLAFSRHNGAALPRDTVFDLPLHVSFRGPVVSILLGVGLLYAFTQAGLWISGL